MRRYVTRNVIHTKSISFVSNTILSYIVALTVITANDSVPTVLVS